MEKSYWVFVESVIVIFIKVMFFSLIYFIQEAFEVSVVGHVFNSNTREAEAEGFL